MQKFYDQLQMDPGKYITPLSLQEKRANVEKRNFKGGRTSGPFE